MNNASVYFYSFLAIFIILLTWLIQWFVASKTKASQPGSVPGKIDPYLSHESFVFRAHRTFMNSLETVPLMLFTALFAIMIGVHPLWAGILLWIFALARIGHMWLYYALATEKNPSPRSYFFIAGLLANIVLLILCGITLI